MHKATVAKITRPSSFVQSLLGCCCSERNIFSSCRQIFGVECVRTRNLIIYWQEFHRYMVAKMKTGCTVAVCACFKGQHTMGSPSRDHHTPVTPSCDVPNSPRRVQRQLLISKDNARKFTLLFPVFPSVMVNFRAMHRHAKTQGLYFNPPPFQRHPHSLSGAAGVNATRVSTEGD